MRLFFALWPNAVTRARLERWIQALNEACGGRRTRTENLHLTLAFLGEVAEERAAAVEHAMERVAPKRFLLTLDRPGYWKKNRIAWAGATEVPAELDILAYETRAGLTAARIAFDPQPFAVHVTLLRDAQAPAAMPPVEPILWPVDGYALVAAVRGAKGSTYEVRRSWTAGS